MKKVIQLTTLVALFSLSSNLAIGAPYYQTLYALTDKPVMQMLSNADLENKLGLDKGDLGKKKTDKQLKDTILKALNVAVAESRFLQVDGSGQVSGLFGKVDAKTKKIQIFLDFGRYAVLGAKDKDGKDQKLGYLMRLEAEINNFDANADLSSLFAVGFAAKNGKIQGTVKVTTIGLSGGSIDQYVTTATSISEDSLQKAIENLAVLKSKIKDDDGITVKPDILPPGI